LLISAQLGLTDLCLELLRYGANVNIKLNDGANVAFLASQTGNLDLLKLLAASGANLGLLRNVSQFEYFK
jgi:ankyrin repeat protein